MTTLDLGAGLFAFAAVLVMFGAIKLFAEWQTARHIRRMDNQSGQPTLSH